MTLLELAEQVAARTLALGADEVTAVASRGTNVSINRRDGKMEQATEASHQGVVVATMVDGRYSSHSTSDLRAEALDQFLERAVAATRYIEEDRDRAQPPAELCGRGVSQEHLDQDDPTWYARTADDRAALAEALDGAMAAGRDDRAVSTAAWCSDGSSEAARVMSNGFSGVTRGAWFSVGCEVALQDDNGKRPEATASYGARYLTDLPSPDEVAAEAFRRGARSLGAGPIASGRYPMLVENRAALRILSLITGPLQGYNLFERRSCLADRLGTAISTPHLTIVDDPTLPRGLGSRPWDGDGLAARPRVVVEAGVLRTFYLDTYYSRKLKLEATTGSRSNWIVTPGARSPEAIAADLPACLYITGFLGGNSNSTTGDFSFGIRGQLLEHGQPVQALSEMNMSGNTLALFQRLGEVGDDPWKWSSVRSPSLLFNDVQFSGV